MQSLMQAFLSGNIKSIILAAIFLVLITGLKTHAGIDDQEFFDSINLNYAGLELVHAALTAGDTSLAKNELLKYYQNRTSVKYFTLSGSGSTSDAGDNLNNYFTVVGIRKYAGEPDSTIDWTIKDENDKEWHYQFHRMYWLTNLGKVYVRTNEEKYAAAWVSSLLDWRNDNPPGYPRTLDTGVRLRNWVESYQYFINMYRSTSVSPDEHVQILKSFIEQCRFLRDNWRSKGNWGASETRGLAAAVIMFPEFKFTSDGSWDSWKELVVSRLDHHLTNDFHPDGIQVETAPMYGCLEYRNLFLAYKLMNLNGIEISNELLSKFVKPLEYMMHIHKPDGYLPQLSDSDRKSYLGYLKEGAELFNRQDMLYASTRGKEGMPPLNTFAAFPEGGNFIMRSNWGDNQSEYKNSSYLVFDTGSNDPWHAHYDILTFEAYANGRLLIRDAGRYSYVKDEWRDYFKGTSSHNTILIDNKNQAEKRSGRNDYWASLPGFSYAVGSHRAYAGLTVKRSIYYALSEYWIISDLVTGIGSHTYELNFHLDPLYKRRTNLNNITHSVTTPDFGLFQSDTSSSVEIKIGWVSDSYNEKEPNTVASYKKEGVPPITFETVLFPFAEGSNSVDVERQPVFSSSTIVDSSQAFCLRINAGNNEDWFYRSELKNDLINFGVFQCDAQLAFVRLKSDGSISSIQFIGGSLMYKGDSLLIDTNGQEANISYFKNTVFIESEELKSAKIWAPLADSLIINGVKSDFATDGQYVIYNTVTGVGDITSKNITDDFLLEQNYPNPFNPITTIKFTIPIVETRHGMSLHTKLKVYDILGNEITTLLNEEKPAGIYEVEFDASNLSSGVYYYTLRAGSFVSSRKMVLLK